MCTCERCGISVKEEDVRNADNWGYSSLCEDCADLIIEYEDEEDE